MNTRALMSVSALLMGIAGSILIFMPHELLAFSGLASAGAVPAGPAPLLVQTLGALYFGFAIMNWMAKGVLIGGIYARPLAMGNFTHFMIGALGLIKGCLALDVPLFLWISAAVYCLFALAFGFVAFKHPLKAGAAH